MAETQDKRSENSGRKYDQKMKPFLVYQYLMRETDEEHFVSAQDIVEYLQENFGIFADRRSQRTIYRKYFTDTIRRIRTSNSTCQSLRECVI
ncbi:MAG: hypothetical protein PUC29_05295 [Clostridia bacterium]|nr:hypothetical protein [Clostridia bacterium]